MTTRARDLAIRTAIGAGRSQLARQLLTETVLITLVGGAFGILLAGSGLRAIEVLGPLDIPRLSEAGLSLPVLIFPAPLTLAVALVRSLVPIVSADKVNLMTLLKESSTGSGAGRIGHASRGGLVIAEIAVAVILLFTSGILLRSLWAAENLNPGFEFVDRWHSVVERPAPGRQDVPVTMVNMADSAYFRTMRIPLVAGRALSGKDKAGGPTVAVINEELVRAWWKDPRSAIGQHIKLGGPCMRLWCK